MGKGGFLGGVYKCSRHSFLLPSPQRVEMLFGQNWPATFPDVEPIRGTLHLVAISEILHEAGPHGIAPRTN
jgi:hypothetical protein